MQPEPFRSFDPGWVIAGVFAAACFLWLCFDILSGKSIHDDDDAEDWDVEPLRSDPEPDPEFDARHRPF